MNTKQREIIVDFLKSLLEDGERGDFVNSYNNGIRFIDEISKTDINLKDNVDFIESNFEFK